METLSESWFSIPSSSQLQRPFLAFFSHFALFADWKLGRVSYERSRGLRMIPESLWLTR